MKRTVIIGAIGLSIAFGNVALAQQEPAAPAKPSLAPFAWMDGAWRGTATIETPRGKITITQTERSGEMLGGAVRLVEGKGYGPKGDVQFNALGVISARPDGKFEMHSWANGRAGIFAVTPVDSGFDWEIPAGPMVIRYQARFANGTWTEVGYRVMGEKPPIEFYRMELKHIGKTNWPAAGSLPPK